jgi:hypothetical protein
MAVGINTFAVTEDQKYFLEVIDDIAAKVQDKALTGKGKVKKLAPDIIERTIDEILVPYMDRFVLYKKQNEQLWDARKNGGLREQGKDGVREIMFKNVLGFALPWMMDIDPDRLWEKGMPRRQWMSTLMGVSSTPTLEEALKHVKQIYHLNRFNNNIRPYVRTETMGKDFFRNPEIPISLPEGKVRLGLDELMLDWRKIFPTAEEIIYNPELRARYAPSRLAKKGKDKGKLTSDEYVTSVQYQLREVNKSGEYKGGPMIKFREQFPHSKFKKIVETMVGVKSDGRPRIRDDDVVGGMGIARDAEEMWNKVFQIITISEDMYNARLTDCITIRDFDDERIKLMEKYFLTKQRRDYLTKVGLDVANIHRQKSKNERDRCAEILLPIGYGNVMCFQAYTEADHRDVDEVEKSNHPNYKRDQENEMLGNDPSRKDVSWTPWHWILARRLSSYFMDDRMAAFWVDRYDNHLSLDTMRKQYKPRHMIKKS